MKKLASFFLTTLLLFGSTVPALAWGDTGHRTVGEIAQLRLGPGALARVKAILRPGESLGGIATWADSVKRKTFGPKAIDRRDSDTQAFLRDARNKSNGGWHFVNLALGCPGYNECNVATLKFGKPDDIVQMINVCIRTLQAPDNAKNPRFAKRNALRLLVHLVGDIHQPLHVGTGFIDEEDGTFKIEENPTVIKKKKLESDIGGNKLKIIKADSDNMHSHWDTDFVNDLINSGETVPAFAGRLKSEVPVEPDWTPAGGVETWAAKFATDSVRISKDKAYPDLTITGEHIKQTKQKNGTLIEETDGFDTIRPLDYDDRKSVAKVQLAKGGFRLAKLLDAIFP